MKVSSPNVFSDEYFFSKVHAYLYKHVHCTCGSHAANIRVYILFRVFEGHLEESQCTLEFKFTC